MIDTDHESEPSAESIEDAERLARAIIEADDGTEAFQEYLDEVDKYPPPARLQFHANGEWHHLQDVCGSYFVTTLDRGKAMLATPPLLALLSRRYPGQVRAK